MNRRARGFAAFVARRPRATGRQSPSVRSPTLAFAPRLLPLSTLQDLCACTSASVESDPPHLHSHRRGIRRRWQLHLALIMYGSCLAWNAATRRSAQCFRRRVPRGDYPLENRRRQSPVAGDARSLARDLARRASARFAWRFSTSRRESPRARNACVFSATLRVVSRAALRSTHEQCCRRSAALLAVAILRLTVRTGGGASRTWGGRALPRARLVVWVTPTRRRGRRARGRPGPETAQITVMLLLPDVCVWIDFMGLVGASVVG
jgi:hypothetical protein